MASNIVIYDASFYEKFLVPNKNVAREKIKHFTRGQVHFMCTNCTYDMLEKKCLERDQIIPGWIGCYPCSDSKPVKERKCLVNLAATLKVRNNAILATGDAFFYKEFKKGQRGVTPRQLERKVNLKRLHEEVSSGIAGEEVLYEIRDKKRNRHTSENNEDVHAATSAAVDGTAVDGTAVDGTAVDGTVFRKNDEKRKMLRCSLIDSDPVQEKQKSTAAPVKEHDEARIDLRFQKMKKKMSKSQTISKSNRPKYFVDTHYYQLPFNIVYDNAFLELYILPKRDTVVGNIHKLLGDEFVFCHTHCVYRKIHQNHLVDLIADLPKHLFHCHHSIDLLRSDFDCLSDLIVEKGLNASLVLATGDSKLHKLMRLLSPVPIIFLEEIDGFELCFEGQTASRGNIAESFVQKVKKEGSGNPSKKIKIPNGREGVIIGEAWKTIRYIESESGAMIRVIRDFASDPSLTSLELTGSSDAIAKAEELIQKVLSESKSSAGEASTAAAAPKKCLESASKKKKGKRVQNQEEAEDYFNSRFN